MAKVVAVTNTTPVIALVHAEQLRLLDSLFSRLLVPLEVWEELTAQSSAREPFALLGLQTVSFQPRIPLAQETESLDLGERAAITLALATPDAVVLLDDLAARRVAVRLGLQVRGTLGVLISAKEEGLIPTLRPLIEIIWSHGQRLDKRLVNKVLLSVGESPFDVTP